MFTYAIIVVCSIVNLQELIQMFKLGLRDYFEDIWNIIDLAPSITATILMIMFLQDVKNPVEETGAEETLRILDGEGPSLEEVEVDSVDTPEKNSLRYDLMVYLQVVTALLLWYKLLKFLRVNRNFAYLIRMINIVVADMFPFFVFFTILLLAFADAFYSESSISCDENPDGENCFDNFFVAVVHSYTTALGEFDTFDEWGLVAWTLFFICTVFNLIVMLNLLIAIIGATYQKVKSTWELYAWKELVSVIADVRDFNIFTSKQAKPCEYLFTAVYERVLD